MEEGSSVSQGAIIARGEEETAFGWASSGLGFHNSRTCNGCVFRCDTVSADGLNVDMEDDGDGSISRLLWRKTVMDPILAIAKMKKLICPHGAVVMLLVRVLAEVGKRPPLILVMLFPLTSKRRLSGQFCGPLMSIAIRAALRPPQRAPRVRLLRFGRVWSFHAVKSIQHAGECVIKRVFLYVTVEYLLYFLHRLACSVCACAVTCVSGYGFPRRFWSVSIFGLAQRGFADVQRNW